MKSHRIGNAATATSSTTTSSSSTSSSSPPSVAPINIRHMGYSNNGNDSNHPSSSSEEGGFYEKDAVSVFSTRTPNPLMDDGILSFAVSEDSPPSAALSNSSSWNCPQCSYKNVDPRNAKCALCGHYDQGHVLEYNRMRRYQQQRPRYKRTSSWSTVASKNSTMSTMGEGMTTMMTVTTPPSPPPQNSVFEEQSVATTAVQRTSTLPSRTTTTLPSPVELPTPHGTALREQHQYVTTPNRDDTEQSSSLLRRKDKNDVYDSNIAKGSSSHRSSRPRRHDSVEDDDQLRPPSPNKRPPKSPSSSSSRLKKKVIARTNKNSKVPVNENSDDRSRSSVRSESSSMEVLCSGEGQLMMLIPDSVSSRESDSFDSISVGNGSTSSFSTLKVSNLPLFTTANEEDSDVNVNNLALATATTTTTTSDNKKPSGGGMVNPTVKNADEVLNQWLSSSDRNKEAKKNTINTYNSWSSFGSPISLKAPGRSSSSPPSTTTSTLQQTTDARSRAPSVAMALSPAMIQQSTSGNGSLAQHNMFSSSPYTVHTKREDTEQASSSSASSLYPPRQRRRQQQTKSTKILTQTWSPSVIHTIPEDIEQSSSTLYHPSQQHHQRGDTSIAATSLATDAAAVVMSPSNDDEVSSKVGVSSLSAKSRKGHTTSLHSSDPTRLHESVDDDGHEDNYANNNSLDTLETQMVDNSPSEDPQHPRHLDDKSSMLLGERRRKWIISSLIGGIIILSIMIAVLVTLLAKEACSSCDKFQVETAPSVAPSQSPVSIISEPVEGIALPPLDDDGSGNDNGTDDVQEIIEIDRPVMELIAVEDGQLPNLRLGSSVSIGGPPSETWISMQGVDFVRVMKVVSETSAPEPEVYENDTVFVASTGQTSELGYYLKSVGEDIPFVGNGTSQCALASGSPRIVTLDSNGLLFVYEFNIKNNTDNTTSSSWDILQSSWTPEDATEQGNSQNYPTSVSISADGRYVATATILPTERGHSLMSTILDVTTWKRAGAYSTTLSEPSDGTDHDVVHVEISNDGAIVIVCTKDAMIVKQRSVTDDTGKPILVDMGGQPILPPGVTVQTCALSGDGSTLGVSVVQPNDDDNSSSSSSSSSSSMVGKTIIFVYQQSGWWQQQDTIVTKGSMTLAFDHSGDWMVMEDSSGGGENNGETSVGVTVWTHQSSTGQTNNTSYVQLDQVILGNQNDTNDEFGGISVALSKRSLSSSSSTTAAAGDNEEVKDKQTGRIRQQRQQQQQQQFLVVGTPLGGKENEGSVLVYGISKEYMNE